MKNLLVILGVSSMVVVVSLSGSVLAGEGHGHDEQKGSMMEHHEEETLSAINVGNKICPVSEESIEAMGKPYREEYNGKVYNLCCKMCAKDFRKDPEKYIEKLEELEEGHEEEKHDDHDHE